MSEYCYRKPYCNYETAYRCLKGIGYDSSITTPQNTPRTTSQNTPRTTSQNTPRMTLPLYWYVESSPTVLVCITCQMEWFTRNTEVSTSPTWIVYPPPLMELTSLLLLIWPMILLPHHRY